MDVGIGLPNGVPGTDPSQIAQWACIADEGPFASVGVVDRIKYDTVDPLVSLAVAAAVTQRVELVTSIVIAPLREVTTMAKQARSVQAVSEGRLTLGLAIGARSDDYDISEFGTARRGDRLSEQLERMRELFAADDMGPVTADPPRMLVGGGSGSSFARAARYADGWIHGGSPPRHFARDEQQMQAAWQDAGRPGRPQVYSMAYYALDGEHEQGRQYMLDYYAFTGAFAPRIADGLLTSAPAIREYVQAYDAAGCDHLLLFPTVADARQANLLAEALT
ncbi:LLM class flavin-dependent oxidoreductase [soil metagenome]